MPRTWNRVHVDTLLVEADSLQRSANRLRDACKQLSSNGIQEPWAPWTEEIPRKIASIATFVSETCAEVEDQISAQRHGHKSNVEMSKERAQREIERRRIAKQKTEEALQDLESRKLLKPPKKATKRAK